MHSEKSAISLWWMVCANCVKILGTNLGDATSVTFNGTPAVFRILSATEIQTTVPKGATTGKIKVVMPTGTLVSDVTFRVF